MIGVMLDCSRNAVLKPETVKEFAQIIRKMGYDTIMRFTQKILMKLNHSHTLVI